jgi:uncharacterized membrane protein
MKLRELNFWIQIRESMWFVPAVLVLGGLVLAPLMIALDTRFAVEISTWLPFVYDGGAEGARLILGTIAGAMATVVGIAFSIAIVVLQLAAAQYSPRVITTFRRDRGQQIVLGTYLATFVYSLLIIRQVSGPFEDAESFIPGLSMLVALGLAITCLGMLVYFVHHTSQQLRVADITKRIHHDLIGVSEYLFPEDVGEPHTSELDDDELIEELESSSWPRVLVRSDRTGYLRQMEDGQLADLADSPLHAARVCLRVGEFVVQRGPLMELFFEEEIDDETRSEIVDRAADCFLIGSWPTVSQNPGSGIQQLVDIALRALSPGVNDPTTAEQVMEQLGDWISRIAHRDFPRRIRTSNDRMLVFPSPSFDDYFRASFAQIRRAARTQVHVLHGLLTVFSRIIETQPPADRLAPIRREIEAIKCLANEDNVPVPDDREELVGHAQRLLDQLPPS